MGNNQQLRMGSVRTTSRVGEKLAEMGEKWEKNRRKMGGKWDEIPICHSPVSQIFPEAEDLPLRTLCKIWYPVSAWKNDKNGQYP